MPNYEYIVVGSGAGGGPLAARLAIAGHSVLLLEAGDDQGASVEQAIPAFFPAASEYVPMSWDFFVRHYPNDTQEALNSKATYETPAGETYIGLSPPAGSTLKGIWYPRTGTLGGCTAHNAMVTVYPHEEDWTQIQQITGDNSWAPANMRQYFERMERNEYLTSETDAKAQGHGFNGWAGVSEGNKSLIANDPGALAMLGAAHKVLTGTPTTLTDVADLDAMFNLDMNTNYTNRDTTDAIYQIPILVNEGNRAGSRDILIATANAVNANGSKKYPLTIRLNTLVTKVRFNAAKRAVGVDFLSGSSLYSADARSNSTNTGAPGSVDATREVILAAGAFNTPQILMLSGVGPAAQLKNFSIPVVANLSGVGSNLGDHYEISTIVKSNNSFTLLEDCTFLSTADDACYAQWAANGTDRGPYATNLLEAAILKTSTTSTTGRDMFIFGGPISFKGYYQGYTADAIKDTYHWTWTALKAHAKDFAGTVSLRSANPLDTPHIQFNLFDSGVTANDEVHEDIQPLIEVIEFGRESFGNATAPWNDYVEEFPGPAVQTQAEIAQFIKNEAWGHHAAGTAKIGAASDAGAVLDSKFRVRGVSGLRVVDASVFPEVPGYFPVVSVYMVSEKAADVMLSDIAAGISIGINLNL